MTRRSVASVSAIVAALVVIGVRVAVGGDPGIPFVSVRQGVTPYRVAGARVFVVRAGSTVTVFNAKSGRAGALVQWCPREETWWAPSTDDLFSESGAWAFGTVNHDLLRFPARVDEQGTLRIDVGRSIVTPRGNGRAEIPGEIFEFYQRYLNYDPAVPTTSYPVFCPNPVTVP